MIPRPLWRVLCHEPADGAWNMAVDETVAEAVGAGRVPPTLRFYGWQRPTVSLGYLQPAQGSRTVRACRRLRVPVVRRPTGGRAVLHARELTYSVAVPLTGGWGGLSIAESFARLSRGLIAGLACLGVAASLGPCDPCGPTALGGEACFHLRRLPAILVGGRKLIGSAQRRWERSLLQHGSLLLDFDAAMHEAIFPEWSRRDMAEGVVWLSALVTELPPTDALAERLAVAWGKALEVGMRAGRLTGEEVAQAEALVRTRYGTAKWTLRR